MIQFYIPKENLIIITSGGKSEVIHSTCYKATQHLIDKLVHSLPSTQKAVVINKIDNSKKIYNSNIDATLTANSINNSNNNLKFIPKDKVTLVKSNKDILADKFNLYTRAFNRAVRRNNTEEITSYAVKMLRLYE